jgi:prepilin-type N-terminal cleavage/methylation domain-containing protein
MRQARRSSQQGGFTLIEILIALSVMAAASVVLMGMQSAAIGRTIRDRNAQQGMLLARRIMASVESIADPNNIQNFENESGVGALQKLGIPDPTEDAEKRALEPFQVTLLNEDFPLPLPNIDPSGLKKITLRVSWGAAIDETFFINFLMATP